MSLIKVALDKEAAGIFNAIKGVGKAISKTIKSNVSHAKDKVEGAMSGFKHSDIASFAKSVSDQNVGKGKRILKLREQIAQNSKAALSGQKAQAEYYNKKVRNLKYGVGATGLIGLNVGMYAQNKYDKRDNK